MASFLTKDISKSAAMRELREKVVPFIDSAKTILFWGETGSGMGYHAKEIHEASGRDGKFLRISCFSLDEEVVKQQFLGIDDAPGWLEKAHNGTIFLKRVSEAPRGVQQILLQLLGNQSVDGRLQFTRQGKTDDIEVNTRFMFSMAQDFNEAIQDNLLRRDLIEEIKRRGIIVRVPPLRERKEDITVIARKFFEQLNQNYKQNITAMNESAQTLLMNYRWPGNVDELKRIIDEVFSHYPGIGMISDNHLPEHLKEQATTGDLYSFKLKGDAKFLGKILAKDLKIESENKTLRLKAREIIEIVRVEDTHFTPAKFKHFLFKLEDGSQIIGKIIDKKMGVWTSFDPAYNINPQELQSLIIT